MSYIKADNATEQKHFDFLERLRARGTTNMFGAARYLREAFPNDFAAAKGFNEGPAGDVLGKWMKLHDDPTRILESAGGSK